MAACQYFENSDLATKGDYDFMFVLINRDLKG